jgi:hypothetical protein
LRKALGPTVGLVAVLVAPSQRPTAYGLAAEESADARAPVEFFVAPGGNDAWSGRIAAPQEGDGPFATIRQLFVCGERRPRTRLPKSGIYRIEALPGYDWARQGEAFLDGTKQFVYAGNDIQPWRNLHDVEVIGITRWTDNHLPIAEVDPLQRLVTFDRPSLFALDDTAPPRPSVYWVENVLEALDTPGQWYLDRPAARLYYLPLPGEELETTEIVAPHWTHVLRVAGSENAPVRHVRFEGLTLSHTEWTVGPRSGL